MNKLLLLTYVGLTAFCLRPGSLPAQEFKSLDQVTFGDTRSEEKHQLKSENSSIISGGLGQQARVLNPKPSPTFEGGKLACVAKVDPLKQNYITVKFWGNDKDKTMLLVFIDGKQIGYRHLGDIDFLWLGNGEPAFNNRFFYLTLPLPIQYTKGRKTANLEIRSFGLIWGYGETFDKYQKNMVAPSLGLYKAYTHTNPAFAPHKKEVQGQYDAKPSLRPQPGEEVMETLKTRVNTELLKMLASDKPLRQQEMVLLAEAYSVKWTPAFNNQKAIDKIVFSIDEFYKAFLKNPELAWNDKAVYNSEWLTTGLLSRSIATVWNKISPVVDETLDNGSGEKVLRRNAWAELLQASLKYSTTHRRHYTNQTMIIDLFTFECSKALALLAPSKALPRHKTLGYLYESVGLAPWLGKETENGPEKPLGDNYWQTTDKGLTKELGFVGYYGEVLDWVVDIYRSTCVDGMPGTGDEKIRQQLLKMMKARTYFRYPALDADGFKAFRAEAVVGWRDSGHYPGNVLYGDRGVAWDASPLMTAAATLDPTAIGIAQEMIADNQFFKMLEEKLKSGGIRVTKSLIRIPDEYEFIKDLKKSDVHLPMSKESADFVFSDEEDGVIAVKNGDEILYASLYWRARNAVNNLARVHYITPTVDRIAIFYIESQYTPSGMSYTRPNWTNMGFSGSRNFYTDVESAHTGEVLPIAKIPDGIKFKPGDESIFAGKADFYKMEYGNYLVGMNMAKDKSFDLNVPEGFSAATNLVTKAKVKTKVISVAPRTTVVLYRK